MLNFHELRSSQLVSWKELWDFKQPYPVNVFKLLDKFVVYPNDEIQKKIVACFVSLHTAALNDAFCLYLTGQSRSGKSTTGKLVAKLTNSAIHGSNSTAGIRNYLEENKFTVIDEETSIENNQVLILEDVNSSILAQPALYQMLKTSCNRETAKATIASLEKSGENCEFDTFSLKIISSVFDPRKDSRFDELVNRCLFIHCQRVDKDLPQVDDYNWNAIEHQHYNFWELQGKEFFSCSSRLRKPNSIPLNQWQVLKPIAVVGLVGGIFKDSSEAFDACIEFLELSGKESINPFYQLLTTLCNEYSSDYPQLKGAIPAQYLEQETRKAIKLGSLPFDRYSNIKLWEAMESLGYISYSARKTRYWVPKSHVKNDQSVPN